MQPVVCYTQRATGPALAELPLAHTPGLHTQLELSLVIARGQSAHVSCRDAAIEPPTAWTPQFNNNVAFIGVAIILGLAVSCFWGVCGVYRRRRLAAHRFSGPPGNGRSGEAGHCAERQGFLQNSEGQQALHEGLRGRTRCMEEVRGGERAALRSGRGVCRWAGWTAQALTALCCAAVQATFQRCS
jgi:hypothetical protein